MISCIVSCFLIICICVLYNYAWSVICSVINLLFTKCLSKPYRAYVSCYMSSMSMFIQYEKIDSVFLKILIKSLQSYLVIFTETWSISYISILSRSFSDHHLRCGGRLNLEFSKRENIPDGPFGAGFRYLSFSRDTVPT